MLNKISKILLYLTIFLLPLIVLPFTAAPVVWSKHITLLVLSSLTLILWLIGIFKSGELKLNWTKLSTAVVILLAVLGLATAFSAAGAASFWSVLSDDSYLNFILYIIIFFLASNIFAKTREIILAFILLLISGSIVNLFFLSHFFYKSLIPWDFAQAAGFNLLGSIWAMAIFFGGLMVILIAFLCQSTIFKKIWQQVLAYLALILFFISLFIIDFQIVWIGISLAIIVVIWQILKKSVPARKEEFSGAEISEVAVKNLNFKPVYLPAIIFIVTVILIVVRIPLPTQFTLPSLVTLNSQSTYDVVDGSFKDSAKNIIIGSGPATFEYQYLLHRPASIVQGAFWQTRFVQGKFALATWLLEFGVVGSLVFLLILAIFAYQGFKLIISAERTNEQENYALIQSVTTVTGLYLLLFWFLYSADFFLLFFTFFISGLWLSITNQNRKLITFIKVPQQAFFIMLLSIVLIAGLAIGLYYSGRKYAAAISYGQALKVVATQNADLDSAVVLLTKAADWDGTNDLYARELSEALLIRLDQLQADKVLTEEQKQQNIQLVINQLEILVPKMIAINPANSQNLEQAARIYSRLMSYDANAYKLAVDYFNREKSLDPTSPAILLNLASLNFELAKSAHSQSSQIGINATDKGQLQKIYEENLKSALDNIEAAIKLKNGYTQAYYFKAVVYEFSGQNDQALVNYQIVLQQEPGNQAVTAKVKALQALIEKSAKVQ